MSCLLARTKNLGFAELTSSPPGQCRKTVRRSDSWSRLITSILYGNWFGQRFFWEDGVKALVNFLPSRKWPSKFEDSYWFRNDKLRISVLNLIIANSNIFVVVRAHEQCTSLDNQWKINSWVSFSFLYGYGAPLGDPSDRRSSANNWNLILAKNS